MQYKFILPLLLFLVSFEAIHAIQFSVINNAQRSPGGKRFSREIGIKYTTETLDSAANFIWNIFNQHYKKDRKYVPYVGVTVQNMDGDANNVNNEILVSAPYIAGFSGNIKKEFTGILYRELTHILQWNNNARPAPAGLIEGIADYVRFKAGYAARNWAKPGEGLNWDQGDSVTARFLDYCDGLKPGLVAELNKKLKNGYSEYYFVELLGKPVDRLWREYKHKHHKP